MDIIFMTKTSLNQASPFICNLNAINPDKRAQHAIATAELFQTVQVVHFTIFRTYSLLNLPFSVG
jgi:hypothetical protein